MRLLRQDSQNNFSLTDDLIDHALPYAILSHTWGADCDEVTFNDLQRPQDQSKAGYVKLKFCVEQARRDGIDYTWIDTCCIKKDNQNELSEAITSMFRWYRDARRCYVYLVDVSACPGDFHEDSRPSWESSFRKSRWFTRGWTLQELLAPSQVEFFSREGRFLGTKKTLARQIHEITSIPLSVLGGAPLSDTSVTERLRWTKNRQTTREEDRAYCLLGVFDISMSLRYGERDHAFKRLQKKISDKSGSNIVFSSKDTEDLIPQKSHRKRALSTESDEPNVEYSNMDQAARSSRSNRPRPPKRVSTVHTTNVSGSTDGHSCDNVSLSRSHIEIVDKHQQQLHQNPPQNSTPDDKDQYKVLLQSLLFDRIDFRVNNVKRGLLSTCQWLLCHPDFEAWNENHSSNHHSGFLWIRGKPGCGKSTLMKTALEWARRRKTKEQIIISYFFHARASASLEKSSLGLYRTMVYHLVSSCPDLRSMFAERFALKEPGQLGESWTTEELQDFLYDAIESNRSFRLCLFIDALDEAEYEDDVRQMIRFLIELSDRASAPDGFYRLQVCLSSRHYPHITIGRGRSLVVEEQPEHDKDIKTYITRELTCLEGSEKDSLRAQILEKSAYIFLWVVLVVSILNKHNDRGATFPNLVACLTTIPADLDELFHQILVRSHDGIETSVLLFQWMLFRMRPLEPAELFLAIEYSRTPSDRLRPSAAEISVPSPDCLSRFTLDCSRGLVEIVEAGRSKVPVVQFIHETVREFLTSNNGLASMIQAPATDLAGISHEVLRVACVRRVSLPGIPEEYEHYCNSSSKTDYSPMKSKGETHSRFSFLDYAVLHLFDHAEQAQRDNVSQQAFLMTCIDAGTFWHSYRLLWNLFKHYVVRELLSDMTLLDFIVERQHESLLSVLLGPPNFADLTSPEGRVLLHRASCHASPNIAQMLLDAGADMNAQGPKGSALQAASSSGSDKVVRILLEAGADVNAQGGLYGNALQAASARGYDEVVRMLLEAGADVNTQGGPYSNALRAASASGCDKIVRMLLEAGAKYDHKIMRLQGHAMYRIT